MRSRGAVVAALVCAAATFGPAVGAQARSGPQPPPFADQTVLGGEQAPVVASNGHSAVALVTIAADPAHARRYELLVRRANPDHTWSPPVVVASRLPFEAPAAAMTHDGRLVLAWAGAQRFLTVRAESAIGSWDTSYVVRSTVFGRPDLSVDGRGDAVASVGAGSGSARLAVLRGGRWSTTTFPGFVTPDVALDRRGVVYAASGYSDRGGDGVAMISRCDRAGHWTRPEVVRGAGRRVQGAQLEVSPAGAITLAVGYASRRWVSTIDTEAYFTTGYVVLRKHSWDRPFRTLWRRDGAVGLTMADNAAGDLHLTWEQWRSADGARRPTHSVLLDQRVLPDPGPVVRIARHDVSLTRGFFEMWSALDTTGRPTVLWQGSSDSSRQLGTLQVSRLRGTRVETSISLVGTQRDVRETGEPSLAGDGDIDWVAWTRATADGGIETDVGSL